jgi:hypothetical protein
MLVNIVDLPSRSHSRDLLDWLEPAFGEIVHPSARFCDCVQQRFERRRTRLARAAGFQAMPLRALALVGVHGNCGMIGIGSG